MTIPSVSSAGTLIHNETQLEYKIKQNFSKNKIRLPLFNFWKKSQLQNQVLNQMVTSLGAEYLVFVSSFSLETREKYISFAKVIFFGQCSDQ